MGSNGSTVNDLYVPKQHAWLPLTVLKKKNTRLECCFLCKIKLKRPFFTENNFMIEI